MTHEQFRGTGFSGVVHRFDYYHPHHHLGPTLFIMGWMRLKKDTSGRATKSSQQQVKDELAPSSAHIEIAPPQETVTNVTETARKQSFQPGSRCADDLPFISQQEVTENRRRSRSLLRTSSRKCDISGSW